MLLPPGASVFDLISDINIVTIILIVIFVIGYLIDRTLHYKRLWIQCKSKVSWIMPSKDPNNWAVQRSFYYKGNKEPIYNVVDVTTKAHVADNFKTEQAARDYINHSRDQFELE